ncbi:MAG TPA: nickel-dependent hydrogenase large subunit [Planctomycetota bacterium]|nr:nickel-dependent hydrogenase large subunit [Planctomycetota bacterium]
MQKIVIDPVTRVEGHLRVEVTIDGGEVKEARSAGTLYRGFEEFLVGRQPIDAQRITQRVCGVCPTAHATASALALDQAFGCLDKLPENGRLLRNLILGANYLQSHILHFYHLAALDYVDVAQAADYDGSDPDLQSLRTFIARGTLAPFVPRYEGDYRLTKQQNTLLAGHYVEALRMRRLAHEMLCVFGGKMPHNVGIIPGGATEPPTVSKMEQVVMQLKRISEFIENVYIPDILAVAGAYPDHFALGKGYGKLLAYGVFELETPAPRAADRKRLFPPGLTDVALKYQPLDQEKISEDVKFSRYADSVAGKPLSALTKNVPDKEGAYSWLKAPRYDGGPREVGPLARMAVGYVAGSEEIRKEVDGLLSAAGLKPADLFGVLGRHACRALESRILARRMTEWALALDPKAPHRYDYESPETGTGAGLVDGPRGALGHWIDVKDGKIANYQLVVPTTWNASPRDANDQPGAIERALTGTRIKDASNPFEVVRIVRSFDPCLACAVHVMDAHKNEIGKYRVA